jgi:3-phenylpropionate/cinnamic acid dioxygenase small subunit
VQPVPLPYTDPVHQEISQFLVEEANLLDRQDYAAWLDLLTDDVRYLMPVRVTTARGAPFDALPDMSHLDENLYSLRKRVARFATEHAFTEDPPSRMRHHVSNVRTFALDGPLYRVESAVLLFRSRGDDREADFVSAGRTDRLRRLGPGRYRLVERVVQVDESVLRTQNLAFFL